jgi:hypothetical protein
MRLPRGSVSALHFTLALAVALLFSSHTFAQHSGGGGGGSASSGSSGGGGGSHGGSSGGSSSSGGGHSSGGGSSSHSSAGHGSGAGSAASHSSTSHAGTSHSNPSHSNTARSVHAPSTGAQGKTQTSEKRGFFSFLRHHVPKPEPKPEPTPKPTELVAKARPPLCFKGPCAVCAPGKVHGGSGCEGTDLRDRIRRLCPAGEYWAGGGCLQQTWYQDECGGLRTMMERQAKRVREAEQDRQISCVLGPREQCSDFTSSAESEVGFYQVLQNRYQACQRRLPTGPRYNGFRVPGYSAGVSFDSLSLGLGRH